MSTEEEKAARLEKIRKLLAKAEAQGVTDEERALYQAKAVELMAKWGIEDAMIGDVGTAKIEYNTFPTSGPKIYQREYILMGMKIAKAFGVKGIISDYGTYECLGLIGFDDDITRITLIWRSLETQLSMALATAIKNNLSWSWMKASEKFNFKRAFILGFGIEVGERLQRIYAEVVEVQTSATPGTALVLANRTDQVEAWARDNMNLNNVKSKQYDMGGTVAGRNAGARADVGQTGVSANTSQPAIGN